MRHAIIVPAEIADNCNQAAHFLGIDPDAKLNTLSVPLIPVGASNSAVATHMACCGVISDEQREYLEANQDAFPGAFWWRWESRGSLAGPLVASYDGLMIGEPWSWARSLKEAGLKVKIISL